MVRSASAVLACALASAPALADDLTPPPWRLSPGSTFQHWDFSAGPIGGPPDGPGFNLFNPYGTPMMTPSPGANWVPFIGGRADVWMLGGQGSLTFDVPNTANSINQKELWLQITFQPSAAGGPPGSTVASPSGPFALLGASYTPLPNGWIHELTRWGVQSCPPFERVSIFNPLPGTVLAVDQVVIDTRCFPIPTPGSAALLAAGGLVAVRRRRR